MSKAPARRNTGRGGGGRMHPYERDGGNKQQDRMDVEEEFETPQNSIKVSGTQDVRELARTICDACRSGDPPALLTIGNNSINQAVKGIAIARNDMKSEGIDLAFQPAFRHVNRTRPLIAFYLSKQRAPRQGGEEIELTVSANSKIIAVAGAIAGKVRESKRVFCTTIGVDAVTNAVLAAGNARLFLEPDHLDIKVQPEFIKITKNENVMNGIKFGFIAESI